MPKSIAKASLKPSKALRKPIDCLSYPLVKIITSKLYGRIWYYPYTIGSITSKKSSESLFSPHFGKRFSNRHLVLRSTYRLYLEQNFQPFQGRYDCPWNRASYSTSYEWSYDRLWYSLTKSLKARRRRLRKSDMRRLPGSMSYDDICEMPCMELHCYFP